MKTLLSFRVNGDPVEVAVRPDMTLTEVLREDCYVILASN